MQKLPEDIAALSYEDARDELIRIVASLEAGSVSLEESMTLWERGEALAARCQEVLDGARERIAGSDDAPEELPVVAIATDLDGEDEE